MSTQETRGRMQETRRIGHPSLKWDLLIALALALLGVLARVWYLALIPVFEDEVLQTVYALNIRPGEFMPLVGNDPYAGPLFSYIIAVCLRVFGSTPAAPRIVVMVTGALTVGATYLLARALGLGRPWGVLVGLLLAANPHHILVSSHYAGTTYILPLFCTGFLLALALAIKRESGPWLIAAGALLGLALQTNPVPALMLPGIAAWFLLQRKPAIGLRTPWPYLAAAACILAYSPVIVYNLQTGLAGVSEAKIRDYVWQPNPSPLAFVQNLGRLALQLCRQVSGVLEGDETPGSLIGLPLLISAWAIAALVYTARRGPTLPAIAVGSQAFIMPWLSNNYGMTIETRFTNQLTPLIFVAMGALAGGVWELAHNRVSRPGIAKPIVWLAGALIVALSLWPLTMLFRYYEHAVARGETNAPYFAFYDEFVQHWRGEKIFVSDTMGRFNPTEYFLATRRVPYDLMPFGRIMEWLALGRETGPVVLILDKGDLARARSQADLITWDSPAMQTARKMGYGAYGIADARQVRKPTFVFTDTTLGPTMHAVQADFAGQLGVIGFEVNPAKVPPGGELVVNVHWQAKNTMPEAYTGFLHLVGPDGRLVAQDDHELGRGFYRTLFWQPPEGNLLPGEVVREKYVLNLPKDAPGGEYTIRVGVYSFPSFERLPARSASTAIQDDTVTLGTVHVGP